MVFSTHDKHGHVINHMIEKVKGLARVGFRSSWAHTSFQWTRAKRPRRPVNSDFQKYSLSLVANFILGSLWVALNSDPYA